MSDTEEVITLMDDLCAEREKVTEGCRVIMALRKDRDELHDLRKRLEQAERDTAEAENKLSLEEAKNIPSAKLRDRIAKLERVAKYARHEGICATNYIPPFGHKKYLKCDCGYAEAKEGMDEPGEDGKRKDP